MFNIYEVVKNIIPLNDLFQDYLNEDCEPLGVDQLFSNLTNATPKIIWLGLGGRIFARKTELIWVWYFEPTIVSIYVVINTN